MDMRKQSAPAGGLPSAAAKTGIASAPRAASAVELHIDELVLHGFAGADRFVVGDAIARELARLIEEHGVPGMITAPATIERLDAGAFTAKADAKAHAVGAQIAALLCRSLSPHVSAQKTTVSENGEAFQSRMVAGATRDLFRLARNGHFHRPD